MNNVFEQMLAAWNATDRTAIRSHLDKAVSNDVAFADPTNVTFGIDEFVEMIAAFRAKYPRAVCRRTSGLDTHNSRYRYSWEIHDGERVFIKGTDFVRVGPDGLIESVDGFFGDLPAA